ncbi:MAG: FIST C-terminal domain-containing protein [Oculatellaceae cyanobacterium Prado106]|jgi:hypothetical protein|nr:FIST C-terminal domain-containing protein [Oculatellaceae cyanobacterium Prado106]
MQIKQTRWTLEQGWQEAALPALPEAQLVLLFGQPQALQSSVYQADLRRAYPQAHLLGCSTAGEILGTQVTDQAVSVTVVQFAQTQVRGSVISLESGESSFSAGDRLGQTLDPNGLVHVFVLSDGLQVNGSDLVRGLSQYLPLGVNVTGGLAGDGADFQKTFVLWDAEPQTGTIAALGFYGDRLKVGYCSFGGWRPFGPERRITRSEGNVLYELDGQSALELYKTYLGEHAAGLPATGLLFPLSLRSPAGEQSLVRTILAISEADQSLTFAGDVPMGATVQLMHASIDRLVDGAIEAAEQSFHPSAPPELAILISCVGRKLVMQQRVEEEVEGVQEVLGQQAHLTGFYSYGEIAPVNLGGACGLHNQTMTITTFVELEG